MEEEKVYDLLIIGAGPAGFGASIYASRYKLEHLIIGGEIGGQITDAAEIQNYPGFEMISGRELMERVRVQAEKLGAQIIPKEVSKIKKSEEIFEVYTGDNQIYRGRSLILALGMKPKKMRLPGEDRFIGHGVSYCSTCDAMFFRNKKVVVVGGGNAAAMAALHLADVSSEVFLMNLVDTQCFDPSWKERIDANEKIKEIACDKFLEVTGEKKVAGLKYLIGEEEKEMAVDGIFVEIGSVPGVMVAQDLGVTLDSQSYIIVDGAQATNLENVYAAGDVTTGSNKFRQTVTAFAEGAVAAASVYKKIKLKK